MKIRTIVFGILIMLIAFLSACKPAKDVNQVGPIFEVLKIKGEYFEPEGFHVANNPKDNCKVPHYHPQNFFVTSICGTQFADPDPASCGFGKVSEVPKEMIRKAEIPLLCDFYSSNLDVSCSGGLEGSGSSALSGEDAKKYDKIENNIVTLTQPQPTTCSPTSAAIDLLHWNSTIAPGIVVNDTSSLILDLAKRMNTSGLHGTKIDKIGLGLASYLSEHAKGKFDVKFYYLSKSTKITKKGPADTPVTFNPTDSIGLSTIQIEMQNKANIIVNYKKEDGEGHSMKLVAVNSKQSSGKYNVAFANPSTGSIMQTTMDYDGNIEVNGQQWKLISIVTVTPK